MPAIRLRRDTAANWAAQNPILNLGEVGIETDTRYRKTGDGSTAWTGLGYDKARWEDIDNKPDVETVAGAQAKADQAQANAIGSAVSTALAQIGSHDAAEDSHTDLRALISAAQTAADGASGSASANQSSIVALQALLASDDVSLDQLQEIVNYIKANRADLDAFGIASIIGLQAALDAKETPAGAQAKADAAVDNAVSDTTVKVDAAEAAAAVDATAKADAAQAAAAVDATAKADAAEAASQPLIPGPYADDDVALDAGLSYGEIYKVDGGSIAWRGLGTDISAYATATGLAGAPLNRLTGFMDDVIHSGVTLRLVTLGRSEFMARSGATHRAVIGPDGTITGTLGDTAEGIEFDAGSGDHFEFANPNPFTNDKIWQIVVVAADTMGSDIDLISGSDGNSGPVTRLQRNGQTQFRVTEGPAGTKLRQRAGRYTSFSTGTFYLYGGNLGRGCVQPIIGIYPAKESPFVGNAWNNETNWRIGEGLNGHNRLDGKVSIALAGDGELTREQIYRIAAAMVRHEVASISPPTWLGFVGDSMTVSTAGGKDRSPGIGEARQEVWVNSASGWQGSFWDMRAVGGRGIDHQEGYFATMMARFAWVSDMPRTMVFWGGFNTPAETFLTQSLWEALADRYVAMAVTAAAAGVKTVHWSRPVDGSGSPGSSYYDGIMAFNDYYKAELAAIDGDHIFYDHRVTFTDGRFDGATRDNLLYGDNTTVHLSAAGIAQLMADFLSQFPNP